ncbi:MAG TPA: ATP-binding protein [Chitinophaga sp.]|uniref:sensor histidine kinase n=1 Tax=Chitinophaga sp. TaxID=1869181 RepID=UPI002C646D53|nr:ATP-binding protein [Chitinophaga sp.]HVI47231.1 ATP-binding protein [Chitinophaga sp.]
MNNDIILSIVMATLLFLLMICFIITFWMIHRHRKAMHIQEKVQLRTAFEQELLRSQLEIKEQTQKNISQEIHDNIGQVLSLVKLNISTMSIEEPLVLEAKITDSKKLLGKVIRDLRDLSASLDTDMIAEKGLSAAIEHELEVVKRTGVYTVCFSVHGPFPVVDTTRELILFRIFQEALNNVIRHARATAIDVTLERTADGCLLAIADDGHGFDENREKGSAKHGMGLRNMRKRCTLINASFFVEANIPHGTVIKIVYPDPTSKNIDL